MGRSPSPRRHNYKRKRSQSRERDKHKLRKVSPSPSTSKQTDFSFLDFKRDLNKIIQYSNDSNTVANSLDDFWIFVTKYEATLKKAGKPVLVCDNDENIELNDIGAPKTFSKFHCINFKTNIKYFDTVCDDRDRRKLTKKIFDAFLNIVSIYIDFKNKEKFEKLKKLRKAQQELPVAKFRNEIISAVQNERVVVVAGDTGCGKSTQVPQYLHEAGFQNIACTQPRRIACVSLSKRVAYEMLTQFESKVGYQIRFEKSKTADTKVCFITEGLLLRQMSSENLPNYDVIILDEIHERHLMGDFLLGVLKCLIHTRTDIKLVLMSATINIKLFENYFSAESAAVIEVPGRLFPIELNYKPIFIEEKPTRDDRLDPQPYVQIMQLVDSKYPSDERGDLLIFMSGVQEITAICDAAQQYAEKTKKWIVLPLHSGLSLAEQDKVFDYPPEGVRKCIVSTNIAETSVTIDGIRFVVDSGKVKEMSYDSTTKMQRLKEFWISKASADQRKGRAGRTGPGVCYRIYSEKQYTDMEDFSTPEVSRVPLASLLLLMSSLGVNDVRRFPFLDAPPEDAVENALLELKQHGALTSNEKLTSLGKALANLPVEVSLAKALVVGSATLPPHKRDSALALAAALGIRAIFTTRAHRDFECEVSILQRGSYPIIKALVNLPVEVSLAKALVVGSATLPPHKRDSALALAAALGIRAIFTTRAHRDFECEVSILQRGSYPIIKALVNLPVEVSLAKALVVGSATLPSHNRDSALALAAALGIRAIFTTRAHRDFECENARKPDESDHGDPLTLLSLYCAWLSVKAEGRGGRDWCRRRGIEEQRLYELTKLAAQLRGLLQDNNLMETVEPETMSSSERALRHGQMKQLKDMRRQYKQKAAEESKRKKRLKVDSWEIVDDKAESDVLDIRDIEFRMTHDAARIRALLSGANASGGRDLSVLKIVLCRALYPQVAVSDEFNHCKSISEQLYHTWSKPFVFLHPNSYFGKNPRVLQLCEADIQTETPPGFKSKLPVSGKHQILCYLSLLETTKPYIVNSMRMPAAQTLLLLAHSIDTNIGFTRIVCDSWLLLEFPYPETGLNLLLKATKLRQRWDALINRRLADANPNKSVESELQKQNSKVPYEELQHQLSCDISSYMNTEVYYTIKRLLPGDLKVLYCGPDEVHPIIDPNPFEEGFECRAHEKKGGVYVTDNIVYNCVVDTDWSYNAYEETYSLTFTCPDCEMALCLSPLERLQHKNFTCSSRTVKKEPEPTTAPKDNRPNAKEFKCESCNSTLYMTPVEILKHKKSCKMK